MRRLSVGGLRFELRTQLRARQPSVWFGPRRAATGGLRRLRIAGIVSGARVVPDARRGRRGERIAARCHACVATCSTRIVSARRPAAVHASMPPSAAARADSPSAAEAARPGAPTPRSDMRNRATMSRSSGKSSRPRERVEIEQHGARDVRARVVRERRADVDDERPRLAGQPLAQFVDRDHRRREKPRHAPALPRLDERRTRRRARATTSAASARCDVHPCRARRSICAREQRAGDHRRTRPERRARRRRQRERADAHLQRAGDRRRDGREARNELRHDDREEAPALEDAFRLANARVGRQRNAAQEAQHRIAVPAAGPEPQQVGDERRGDGDRERLQRSRCVPAIASAPASIIVGTAGIGRPSCCSSTFSPTRGTPYSASWLAMESMRNSATMSASRESAHGSERRRSQGPLVFCRRVRDNFVSRHASVHEPVRFAEEPHGDSAVDHARRARTTPRDRPRRHGCSPPAKAPHGGAKAGASSARRRGPWLGIFVVFVVLSIALVMVPIVGSLVHTVLTPVFAGGVMLGCHALARGEPLTIGHLFEGFQRRALRAAAACSDCCGSRSCSSSRS